MVWKVKAWVGRRTWTWSRDDDVKAKALAESLRTRGFSLCSKRGTTTIYPAHRISRITIRAVSK